MTGHTQTSIRYQKHETGILLGSTAERGGRYDERTGGME